MVHELQEYSHILTSFLALFEHQFGDMEMKPMWKGKSPKIATALAVAYTFVQVGGTGAGGCRGWAAGRAAGRGASGKERGGAPCACAVCMGVVWGGVCWPLAWPAAVEQPLVQAGVPPQGQWWGNGSGGWLRPWAHLAACMLGPPSPCTPAPVSHVCAVLPPPAAGDDNH